MIFFNIEIFLLVVAIGHNKSLQPEAAHDLLPRLNELYQYKNLPRGHVAQLMS